MTTDTLPAPLRQTANPAPVRPANSVRRTCSIDVSWPDGPEQDRLFIGTARDLLTSASGSDGKVLAEARMEARLSKDKTITSITADPTPANLGKLVGQRAGGHLRLVLREAMPELIENADPLYLTFDDLSGTALVSPFAWSQWSPEWAKKIRGNMTEEELEKTMARRIDVCWGLKEGNSAVRPGAPPISIVGAEAGDLRNPVDAQGWHALPENDGAGFRRARRIDVTRDERAGVIRIDSAFQDSAKKKDGGRSAIHEYSLSATADPDTLELLTLEPTAHILPYSECPAAVHNTQRLIGSRIDDIRDEVLTQLRGTQGCTHLNDALRALAEVPRLASNL